MNMKAGAAQWRKTERMSDTAFRLMKGLYRIVDFVYPHVDKLLKTFGVKEGMTVVDYGCGPGRYDVSLARLVGEGGKVYAVDIHELAIASVRERVERSGVKNIEPVLADGYDSTLPDNVADLICALDMFFAVKQPTEFLTELKRIIKPDGVLVIDDGHQARSATREKIRDSGLWDIVEDTKDHLKCQPR